MHKCIAGVCSVAFTDKKAGWQNVFDASFVIRKGFHLKSPSVFKRKFGEGHFYNPAKFIKST